MKKYLVVATVLVALVALFSIGASAADVALDANVAYTADTTGVSIDSIAVNLSGAEETTGYYTVLAYTGTPAEGATSFEATDEDADILYAAQEVNAITGFNIPASKLKGNLYVKFGGTGLDATAADAEFVFALVALNADRQYIAMSPYGSTASLTLAEGAAVDSYVIFGAEVKTAAEAGLTDVDANSEHAIRSFRTIVTVAAE